MAEILNEYRLIDREALRANSYNPRRNRSGQAMAELIASVKAVGLLEPLLVRPIPVDRIEAKGRRNRGQAEQLYEVVAGERRLSACVGAGVDPIPCIVRELTDRQALEIAVTENEIREDVSPLEKAEGYGQLIEKHGASVEEIAVKVGKAVSTIRGLLRLRQLPAVARLALESGTLPASTAELIARIPAEGLRDLLARHVLAGETYWHDIVTDEDLAFWERPAEAEPLTYRQTKDLIAHSILVELKGAVFSRTALDLIEDAGSCKACKLRVGNLAREDPDAWAGVRADVCTLPACYRAKEEAHHQQLLVKAKQQGYEPMGRAEALRTFDGRGELWPGSPWVDLDSPVPYDRKKRTHRECIGDVVRPHTVAAVDSKGKLRLLAPAAHVRRALDELARAGSKKPHDEAAGNGKPAPGSPEHADDLADRLGVPREDMRPAPEPAPQRRPHPHQVAQRAARIAGQVLYEMLAEEDDPDLMEPLRLLVLGAAWENTGGDGSAEQDLQTGVLTLLNQFGTDDRSRLAAWRDWAGRALAPQLLGLLLKSSAMHLLTYPESPGSEAARALLDFAELDWEQLKEQALRELSGGESAKPKATGRKESPC